MQSLNTPSNASRFYLWEGAIRVFHWLLVLTMLGSWLTIENGYPEWHGRLGIIMIGLLTFRLVLGFFGGELIRFSRFIAGPRAVIAYLRGQWQGYGHNPLGAYSVVALLTLITWQALSGLFVNDDIAFDGPWVVLISKETSDWISGWHKRSADLLLIVIGLHLAAIIFYSVFKKERLVPPMVTGWKKIEPTAAPEKTFTTTKPSVVIMAIILAIAAMALAANGGKWFVAF